MHTFLTRFEIWRDFVSLNFYHLTGILLTLLQSVAEDSTTITLNTSFLLAGHSKNANSKVERYIHPLSFAVLAMVLPIC